MRTSPTPWLILLLGLLVAGCAHKPLPDHGSLTRISLIPVATPRKFPLAYDDSFDKFKGDRKKLQEFEARMRDEQKAVAGKLQRAIQEELPQAGYEVTLIERPFERSADPDDIDYSKIQADGPVLHVWIQNYEMDAKRFLPNLTVAVTLIYPGDPRPSYDEWLYYGAETKAGKNWSVPGSPPNSFSSLDQVVDLPGQVIENFDQGFKATARHMATEFRRALK